MAKSRYRFVFITPKNVKKKVIIFASTWEIANKRFYKQEKVKEVISASKQ